MATLTNPINKQSIVDRFADYVVATANAGIVWGTNANPSYTDTRGTVEVVPDTAFGGTTAGQGIAITGANIAGTTINADNIYNTLLGETSRYCRIRKLQAKLVVTGAGGNNGTRDTAGTVYDTTNVAYMSSAYDQTATPTRNINANNVISSSQLETQFDNLRSAYQAKRDTIYTYTTTVCHASCHSSCHSSRGRR